VSVYSRVLERWLTKINGEREPEKRTAFLREGLTIPSSNTLNCNALCGKLAGKLSAATTGSPTMIFSYRLLVVVVESKPVMSGVCTDVLR